MSGMLNLAEIDHGVMVLLASLANVPLPGRDPSSPIAAVTILDDRSLEIAEQLSRDTPVRRPWLALKVDLEVGAHDIESSKDQNVPLPRDNSVQDPERSADVRHGSKEDACPRA